MMKALKILVAFFVLCLPSLVFGQSISNAFDGGSLTIGGVTVTPSFTPSMTDLSVNYLGQIFGTVGTVLHGTSGQMLGQLFKVFNIGMLVIAGIVLIYTIFMTVLNTAHEGEFMGRKWNSAWIAIRTILGLGLLVPSATTGYSTIQIIVMWIVIQGVGFANMAWYNALDYIAQGGSLYTPPATDTASMIDLVGTVMEMQVCMYSAQNVEQTLQQNLKQAQQSQQTSTPNTNTAAPTIPGQTYVQNFTPLFTVIQNKDGNYSSVVKFPGNKYQQDGQQDNACGQINFGSKPDANSVQTDQKISTLQAAIQQIILDTNSYAKEIVNPTTTGGNSQNFPNQVQSAIVGAAADWVNITLPIRAKGSSISDSLLAAYAKDAVEEGWIMAGRFYFALGSIQQQVTAASSVSVTIDVQPAGFPASSNYISFKNMPMPSATNMDNLLDFSASDKNTLVTLEGAQGVGNYVNAARTVASSVDEAGQVHLQYDQGGILNFLLSPIETTLFSVVNSLSTATGDPILVLQGMGTTFIALATTMWLAGTIGVFSLGTSASVLSSVQPLGYGVEDAVFTFIPTFTAFILVFFTLGSTFAYYIPLIPFIIFVFSAIGWLIAVIEAMVAAPLVALGVTHPEGQHDLLGKSEQAIMLLLSVFLRPVLMIIGLIAGMILSRVVLRFLNSGFFGIVFDVGDFNIFAFVAILVVYCMLLVSIVNQAFSLIYVIPDRVMRWLGVSEQTTGPQEALQGSKQGFEQVGASHEKLGSGVGAQSSQFSERQLKRERALEAANKSNETSAKPK